MEGSINMTSDIFEQIFNSDGNFTRLNTPRPSADDTEYRDELNSNDELTLPKDLADLFNNVSLSSTDLLLEKSETIISDTRELKQSHKTIKANFRRQKEWNVNIEAILRKQEQSIAKNEETLGRLEKSNEKIIKMLEQLLSPNTFVNETSQRFVQSKRNVSEFRTSLSTNQEVSMNRNRNLMENNQERHTMSLPFESDFIAINENRNPIGPLTTTNELNLIDPLSDGSDEIDKILLEKNRGKIQIGQWCYEINVGTTDDAPALITATDHVSSTIPVLHENQSQRTNEDRGASTSNSINYQLSPQLITANQNLLSACERESPKLCLLHPLEEQISGKADRSTKLKDCFGNAPVLIVCDGRLPDDIRLEMAMIFSSSEADYHSVYKFPDGINRYKDSDSRSIRIGDDRPQRIELIQPYPPGEPKNTEINSRKDLNDKYNFKYIRLAIRCFQNERLLLDGDVFYSNLLQGVLKIQSSHYHLNISTIHPYKKIISFDNNNQCQMKFLIKIPDPFHCTLISGYKWFEISIITNGKLNTIYSIDTGNGDRKNPNYFNIKQNSFKMPIKIIKQTLSDLMNNRNVHEEFQRILSEKQTNSSITYDISINDINSIVSITGLNCFSIQIRLLHSEGFPNEKSIKYYTNCATWKSKKIMEDIVSPSISDKQLIISQEQNTVRNIAPKRMHDVICDYSLGLPVCKAAKTSEHR